MIECEDCPYYEKNNEGVGDCFYYTKTRPCDDHKDADAYIGYWHPFPQEKPLKKKYKTSHFIVTVKVKNGTAVRDAYYDGRGGNGSFSDGYCHYTSNVIAWAEFPTPYEE